MKKLTMTLMVGAATLALSTPTMAQSTTAQTNTTAETQAQIQPSAGGAAQTTTDTRISDLDDNRLVVITGTVDSINDDEFTLNYGGNENIVVELDRFGFDGDETEYLAVGEPVTVSGYIDDDLFEGREIEALDVRLNDSNVYYYYDIPALTQQNYNRNNNNMQANNNNANSNANANAAAMNDGSYASLTGSVTALDGDIATIRTNNNQTMTVDLSELGYDATDDEGMQKIEVGDRLYVYGEMDEGFFSDKRLVADGAVELRQRGNTMTGASGNTTNNSRM